MNKIKILFKFLFIYTILYIISLKIISNRAKDEVAELMSYNLSTMFFKGIIKDGENYKFIYEITFMHNYH